MKRDQQPTHDKSRRKFIQSSATAGVGFAVAASLTGEALAADGEASDVQPNGGGYRLTNHILDYYKTIAS